MDTHRWTEGWSWFKKFLVTWFTWKKTCYELVKMTGYIKQLCEMEIVTRCLLFLCHLKHLILGQSLWRDGIFVVIISVHVTNYLLFGLYFIHWCMFVCLSLLLCCFKSGDSNVFANSQKNWHSLFSAAFHPIMSIFNAMSLPDATSLMLYLHGWPEGWIINTPVYPYRLGGACTQHDLAERVKAAPSSPAGAAFIGAKRT